MNTSGKFAVLKQYLSELTFARVRNAVAKDENLIAFTNRRGTTTYDDDPDFEERRREIGQKEWYETDRSYIFYYGFAEGTKGGDIHFDSKGHSYRNENFCELGVITKQQALNPPKRGCMIVGHVVNPERPHFCRWARCTESEKLFAEFVLGGKSHFSSEDLRQLYVHRHVSEGEHTNHLINMAMLLLAQDMDYYLDYRIRHGGNATDGQVHHVCVEMNFDPELWEKYKEKALTQNLDPVLKYSALIPKPAPKPIIERRDVSDPEPVGIYTPFAGLKL